MIIDRRKFITKWSLYGIASFHFTLESIQTHSRGLYTPYKKATPNYYDVDWTRVDAMPHNADGLSGRGLMTALGEGKDRSFNKITELGH